MGISKSSWETQLEDEHHLIINWEISFEVWISSCTIIKRVNYKVREFLDLLTSTNIKLLKYMSIERLDKSLKILVRYRSNHESLMKMKTSLINTLEDWMEKRPVK